MTALGLQKRFLLSFDPLLSMLELTGIRVVPVFSSSCKIRKIRLWSIFLLVFCVQSNIYILFKRTYLLNNFSSSSIKKGDFIGDFTDTLTRMTSFICDTVIHAGLIFTVERTIVPFLGILQSVDCILERPVLLPIQRISLLGLIYLLLTLNLNLSFSIYWELNHPTRAFIWFETFQNTVRVFANQWFSVMPVWILTVCGELIVFYFENIASYLKNQKGKSVSTFVGEKGCAHEMLKALRSMKQLNLATQFLHQQLSTLLMTHCFLNAMILLTSFYFFIYGMSGKLLVLILWEPTDVMDSLFRFWLTCHTYDRMRQAAKRCIPIIREIRDDLGLRNEADILLRHKITLHIIEIATIQKDINRLSLFGMLPLTKNLILKVTECVATYLIIMFQFRQ